jgi:hypothetical protein
VYLAERPEDKSLFAYRVYGGGNRTAKMHVDEMLHSEPKPPVVYGGAKSEQQWRDEFRAGGLVVKAPLISDVEVGIDRVYAQFAQNKLFVFEDLDDLVDEIENYTRKTDDEGNVYEEIANKKKFHRLDALRYIVGSIRSNAKKSGYTRTEPKYGDSVEIMTARDNWYGR